MTRRYIPVTRRHAIVTILGVPVLLVAGCGGGGKGGSGTSSGGGGTSGGSGGDPTRPLPNALQVRMVFAPSTPSRDIAPVVTEVTIDVDLLAGESSQTLGHQVLARPAQGGVVTSAPFSLPKHGTLVIKATGKVQNSNVQPVGMMRLDTKNATQLPDDGVVTFSDDDQDVADVKLLDLDAPEGTSQMVKGDSRRLYPMARNGKGEVILSPNTTEITSTNPGVARVDPGNVLVAAGEGTASISVAINGRAAKTRAQPVVYTVVTPAYKPVGSYDDWVPVPVGEGGTTGNMAGYGYNLTAGQPVRTVTVFANPIGQTQDVDETFYESRIQANSASYLSDTAINFRARLAYWGAKLDTSFKLERHEAHAENDLNIEIDVSKRYQPDYMEDAGKWKPEALDLWENDRSAFYTRYGTHAIIGRQRALRAAIRINIANVSREEKRLLEAALAVKHSQVNIAGDFRQAIQSALRNSTSAITITSAGQDFPDITVPTTLEGIDAWASEAYSRLSSTPDTGRDETYWLVPYNSLKGGLIPKEDYTANRVGRRLYEKFVDADLNVNALETMTAGFSGDYSWVLPSERSVLTAELTKARSAITQIEQLYRRLANDKPLTSEEVDSVYDYRAVIWPQPKVRLTGSGIAATPVLSSTKAVRLDLSGGNFGRIRVLSKAAPGYQLPVDPGSFWEFNYDLLSLKPIPGGQFLSNETWEEVAVLDADWLGRSANIWRRRTAGGAYRYLIVVGASQGMPAGSWPKFTARISVYGPDNDAQPILVTDIDVSQ